ncbi:MAG: cbb3-type cytochrome c oxidase subunit II, partial [Acidobacteriota bacterium]
WLLTEDLNFEGIQTAVNSNAILGAPYTEDEVANAPALAREQARGIAEGLAEQGGKAGLEGKKIIALIAYLQRMGTDISKPEPAPPQQAEPVTEDGVPTLEPASAEEPTTPPAEEAS